MRMDPCAEGQVTAHLRRREGTKTFLTSSLGRSCGARLQRLLELLRRDATWERPAPLCSRRHANGGDATVGADLDKRLGQVVLMLLDTDEERPDTVVGPLFTQGVDAGARGGLEAQGDRFALAADESFGGATHGSLGGRTVVERMDEEVRAARRTGERIR